MSVDFTGSWKNTKHENIDAFLAAQGKGFMKRKVAAQVYPKFIIKHDTAAKTFAVKVESSVQNVENNWTFGVEQTTESPGEKGRFFVDTMEIGEDGKSVILHRKCREGTFSMENTYSMSDDGKTMTLVMALTPTGKETTVGKRIFSKE